IAGRGRITRPWSDAGAGRGRQRSGRDYRGDGVARGGDRASAGPDRHRAAAGRQYADGALLDAELDGKRPAVDERDGLIRVDVLCLLGAGNDGDVGKTELRQTDADADAVGARHRERARSGSALVRMPVDDVLPA